MGIRQIHQMMYLIMWSKNYIFIIFILSSCDSNKSEHELYERRNNISRHAINSWSTLETSALLKLIIIYDNCEFNAWESSDVGGLIESNGKYEITNDFLILTIKDINTRIARYNILTTPCGMTYLKSEFSKEEALFPCNSVKKFDEWGGFIHNDPDFQKLGH
jgi:hypothetical protein